MNDGIAEDRRGEIETVDYGNELLRKGIHLCSLSIPIVYTYVSRELMLTMLVPVAAAFVAGDVMRLLHRPSFELYRRIFGRMLRRHEKTVGKKTLNGASWVLISAIFCVLVFPKLIAVTAFAVLIISDTVAALIGRKYGTRRFRDKSLEGSSAFVVSALIVILLTPKIAGRPEEYLIAWIASVVGAVAEVFSFDIIDDNFAIPVALGFALWLMYILFLPQLNVHVMDS
jgi:dolichol kinase